MIINKIHRRFSTIPYLSRFNSENYKSNPQEVIKTFNQDGAIIWNENILTPNSTISNWKCSSEEFKLKRVYLPDHDFYKTFKFSISSTLSSMLKKLLINIQGEHNCLHKGLDGPYLRNIEAQTLYGSFSLRDDWHIDSFPTITIIIPLVEFNEKNGATQLMLRNSYPTYFTGEPFKPLIMNGCTLHRQTENKTLNDRPALLVSIDLGAF